MNKPATVRTSKARAQALELGRAAVRAQQWSDAFAQLSAADRESPLDAEDLEGLALSAHLLGKEVEFAETLSRAHQRFLAAANAPRAARCAFWLGFASLNNGDMAQAGGWLARAQRLIEEGQHDCVERGYLLVPAGIRILRGGDAPAAYNLFVQAAAIGERFCETDLIALARHGQGRSLIGMGEVSRGVSLLDESMVAVTTGEASPFVIGGIYCSVIDACTEIFDLRRAQEWTAALDRWCSAYADLAPYRGACLIRRAEILQLHGAWPDAMDQAQRAGERLTHPKPKPAAGVAFYRIAELHRLRGEFREAEAAYRQASVWERTPQPGFALLRLAQGQIEGAQAAIRQVADEVRDAASRPPVLDAYVEIMLAAGDVGAARAAAEELSEIAGRLQAPLLDAVAARAMGAVRLAEQDARQAAVILRQSFRQWQELEAPYEAARTRVLIALACRAQGNSGTAELEFAAARAMFQELGAAPDLARMQELLGGKPERAEGPLTTREMEVLVLLASGRTNRSIAEELGISEKTIARHVSNIFTKLDLPSRAAATAYAYQHGLIQSAST